MGTTERRCTNFFLSLVILLLGIGSTVLLYYAGQTTVDLFWGETSTYKDELGRIHRRVVTDDWYGLLVLRGWAFGLLYVVPGLSGITASLFYNRPTMVVHLVIAIISLVPGSVLHSIGAVGLVMYRILAFEDASGQSPWLGDCIYVRDNAVIPNMFEDPRCMAGRRALILAIAATVVLFVAWLFVLSHVLYCAFTYSSVRKNVKKLGISSRNPRRYSRLVSNTNASNGTSDQAPSTVNQASGEEQAYVGGPPKSRGKKVAPVVPPQALAGQATTHEPHPSTSAAEAGADGGVGGRCDESQGPPGEPAQSVDSSFVPGEAGPLTQGEPGDSGRQPEAPQAEESPSGERKSHTSTFTNVMYDSS